MSPKKKDSRLRGNDGESSYDKLLQETLNEGVYNSTDYFEKIQLAQVIRTCKKSKSMAEAGRILFDKSRLQKSASNDSQRLRSYLKKYHLEFKAL